MKLAISTTLAFILCIVLSVGASTSAPNDNDAAELTNDFVELLSKPGTNADAAELTKPDSANLRGGRKLGSYCHWKGKKYHHGKWAYDCDAKHDKCQCICDSWGGGCKWKNCQDDHHHCGGGSYCHWKGKKYHHGKWAYDCDAKHDKCQCFCDPWGGGCKWKNCQDDHDYCGW